MELISLQIDNGFRVTMKVTTEGEEWRTFLAGAADALQRQKPVPGYPAGGAPIEAAADFFGRELIKTAGKEAVDALLLRACAEKGLAPISPPSAVVRGGDLEGFCFEASFTTFPDLPAFGIEGITVEKPVVVTTDAEVDEALEDYMRKHLWVHEVDREARMGDIVEISFSGTHQGERFEYDHSDKCRFPMGSGQLFAGLDEALLGRRKGDELALKLTMPEDFHREAIRGFVLDLKVRLRGVWAREQVACTDEYCREMIHDSRVNTVAEFREKLRKEIQDRHDRHCGEMFEKHVEDALEATVTCRLPDVMVETVLNEYLDALRNAAAGKGKTVAELLKDEGKTMDEFLDMCRPNAEKHVRRSIAIDHLIRKYGLGISEQELESSVKRNAALARVSEEEAIRRAGGKDGLTDSLLNAKALRFFSDHIRVVEKIMDKEPKE